MGSAKYVGRVGGLAVALGVGTAILLGQGVAHADESETSKAATTSSATSTDGASSGSDTGQAGKRSPEKSQAAGGSSQTDSDEADDTDETGDQKDRHGSSTVGSSDRRDYREDVDDAAVDADQRTADETSAAEEEPTEADSPSSASVGVAGEVDGDEAGDAPTAQTAAVTVEVPESLTPADDVPDPLGGTTPAGGSVTDLLLLAGTRRELTEQQTLALPSVEVTDGVIGGCVVGVACSTADGSTYTVIGDPSKGGKVALDETTGAFTFLPFAPERNADGTQNSNGPAGQETFDVLVAQNTAFTTFVTGLPLVGSSIIAPVIMALQQMPFVSVVLAPLIGTAQRQQILVDVDALRGPANTPVAYTTMVKSWDGVLLSTNFFPAISMYNPDDSNPGYETIFNGPGLASAGATNPDDVFVSTFREAGYNVVTWDPRGEFDSGGVLQLDSPQYEGQDVSQLITWAAGLEGVELDGVDDPNMGMVGVSYGGGIQLVTAAGDSRVDAISPGWAWNTLPDSLYPEESFKTSYSALLLLGLVTTGSRINPQIYGGIITGATLGILTPSQIQLLQTSGPGQTVRGITAPTLIIQGTVDVLFPLQQSLLNAGYLAQNENVKVLWFCGGHGSCLPGQGNPDADDAWVMGETLAWMGRYVKDDGTLDDTVFEWTDQYGDRWTSEVRPTDEGFHDEQSSIPTTTWDTGKVLPILPIVGGSGPNPEVPLPYSLGDGSIATNAVSIELQNPAAEANVVGAPQVVINYSGLGTSRHIYAQVVDKSTGLVVGNIVSPIPVTLNGRDQTATFDLNDIAYTVGPDSELELQIFTTATPYLNLTQFGFVNIQSVEVTMPTTTKGTNQGPNAEPVIDEELIAV